MDDVGGQLFLIAILILLNGYFAMVEIALLTAKKSKLKAAEKEGDKKASITLDVLKNSKRFLSTIQIGITFAGFLASASTAVTLAEPLSEFINEIPVRFIADNAYSISVFIMTLFISYITLVLGELVPKQLALRWPEKISLFSAPIIKGLGIVTFPLVKLLSVSTTLVLFLIPGAKPETEEEVTEEDLKHMLYEAKKIKKEEKSIIGKAMDFGDTRVKDIMTPRPDIIFVKSNDSIPTIMEKVSNRGLSRFPVIGEDLDDILGIVHVRDIITHLNNGEKDLKAKDIMTFVPFVPETKSSIDMLTYFKKVNKHMAIVSDEFGGTSGLITMENLLEEIVGDIKDEHDLEEIPEIKKIEEDIYSVEGNIYIKHLNKTLNIKIPESKNYDTLAGFVIYRLNHIPEEGEKINVNGWNLKVQNIEKRRIKKIIAKRITD
jgi:putative hemolysin